jgi:hypothetical protein
MKQKQQCFEMQINEIMIVQLSHGIESTVFGTLAIQSLQE